MRVGGFAASGAVTWGVGVGLLLGVVVVRVWAAAVQWLGVVVRRQVRTSAGEWAVSSSRSAAICWRRVGRWWPAVSVWARVVARAG
jgi:hypothetical protein